MTLTPREKDLISRFVVTPREREPRITKEEFLQRFRPSISDGQKLSLELLEEAARTKNGEDIEYALIVVEVFGFSQKHRDMLCVLAGADWHRSHEDIISILDVMRDPKTIDVLYHATQKTPKYLAHDKSRSLAVKAIYALGKFGHPRADEKLRLLAKSKNRIIRKTALYLLELRANVSQFPPEVS